MGGNAVIQNECRGRTCRRKDVCLCTWINCRLREREERCRRREPRCDDQQLGRLQERLSERDQLIKRLVVRTDRHTHSNKFLP